MHRLQAKAQMSLLKRAVSSEQSLYVLLAMFSCTHNIRLHLLYVTKEMLNITCFNKTGDFRYASPIGSGAQMPSTQLNYRS